MDIKKIEEFAKERGFDSIKYAGRYNGKLLYEPERKEFGYIGMPFFILVDGNKIEMVTGKQGLQILNELLSKKNVQDSKTYVAVKDGNAIIFDDRWITINADPDEPGQGQHVLIKENGDIVAGLGGKFKNLKDLGKKKNPKELFTEKELYAHLKTVEGNRLLSLAGKTKEYEPVKFFEKQPTEEEIISNLGGPDKTKGSCASLALAYTAQKGGLNVLDFKGGDSRTFFADSDNKAILFQNAIVKTNDRTVAGTMTVLQTVSNAPEGKEFLLATGNHMAVVRKGNNGLIEYLELQNSKSVNGWKRMGEWFSANTKDTLRSRFKTKVRSKYKGKCYLYDCDKLREEKNFKMSLGFINTEADKQQKGMGGGMK